MGFDISVFDVDEDNVTEENRNGFTFTEATEEVSSRIRLKAFESMERVLILCNIKYTE